MSRVLVFWVEGTPVPKARARTVRTKTGRVVSFTPKRTAAWEQRVKLVAQSACSAVRWRPERGAYSVEIVVHRARRAGDGDNFLKAAKDALNGVCWPDDRMVMTSTVKLIDGEGSGMRVRVTRLDVRAA